MNPILYNPEVITLPLLSQKHLNLGYGVPMPMIIRAACSFLFCNRGVLVFKLKQRFKEKNPV
jgi:hypothetical protein